MDLRSDRAALEARKDHMKSGRRVVITGMGVVSPLGSGVEEFWSALLGGASGARAITEFDVSRCRSRISCPASGFAAEPYFTPRELKRISRISQLAIKASDEALTDAATTEDTPDREQLGVIMGTTLSPFVAAETFYESYFVRGNVDPLTIPYSMRNAPASNVSIRFGLRGPLMTTDAACASSAHAVGMAALLIRSGQADAVLAGGADSGLSPRLFYTWDRLRVMATGNDCPERACKPFSRNRDGFVMGEGAGMLLLEEESAARRRGARIYAEVAGYGAASDSYHLTEPTPAGPAAAMTRAMADAELGVSEIDYINAHASATPWNDRVETRAIKDAFEEHAYRIPIVGIKGATGHLMGAGGAIELISCVLALRDGIVPPTLNFETPDPDCDLDYVVEGARRVPLAVAMSNSFAFGGSNASLVLRAYAESNLRGG